MKNASRLALVAFAALLTGGCGILYTDIRVPRAYRSATPADVKASAADKTVMGESCARSALYLVAWGDAGYAAAARDALKGEPPGTILYDVQADRTGKAYLLGLYAKMCTRLTGRAAAP
jgi:hypothetical protein